MANSKSSDKHQHLLPIFKHVNSGKCSYKKNVINCRPIDDVFPSYFKIENEIVHVHPGMRDVRFEV
jgi:hypothetical protein